MNNKQRERYSRQLLLPHFGETAQQKLLQAKILVIGAGGLGCPILQYLAAAGIGTIGIADADIVSLSNLQRQVLYTTADTGKYKVIVAAARLRQMNPGILINGHVAFVDNTNVVALVKDYDMVIDATDNFAARYLINDACVLLGKPLVFGAVYQYEGQVAVFNVPGDSGVQVNYRHLFPTPPALAEAPNCAAAGVLGVLPGTIGIMQATEAIKLVTGIGTSLKNKLLTYNALTNESYTVDVSAAFETNIIMPRSTAELERTDYEAFCNSIPTEAEQINAATFYALLKDERVAIIDVREYGEQPPANFRHTAIPLSVFKQQLHQVTAEQVVLFCQSGIRSLTAAELLITQYRDKKRVYNLKGGILSL